ncbi:MAG: pentapeptide repeat-containing protein, partial [Sphingobacteriales bacterium]
MDKNQIIQELKKGAKSWNAWRKRLSGTDLNLDGIELSRINLDDIDLSKVSIRNAKITDCTFKNADLISTNFEGSLLQRNDFTSAKLIATNLGKCDLDGSILLNANMLTAITRNAKLENIDFRGRDISG